MMESKHCSVCNRDKKFCICPTHMDPHDIECSECGQVLHLQVCKSAAGYYLGYFCSHCGPYHRSSGYFQDRTLAEHALMRAKDSGG